MISNNIMQERPEGEVHVRITNISNASQSIVGPGISAPCDSLSWGAGQSDSCGWAFAPIVSDNRAITVDSGTTSCNSYFRQADQLTLRPGEIWERDCRIIYHNWTTLNPKPVTFRMGIVSPGQKSVWSEDLTVNIIKSTRPNFSTNPYNK